MPHPPRGLRFVALPSPQMIKDLEHEPGRLCLHYDEASVPLRRDSSQINHSVSLVKGCKSTSKHCTLA